MELKVDRLTKQYKGKIAVDRVSLSMTCGVYGLLGANGAGKTTLMRMLCGILTPTSGQVLLDGRGILELGEQYRDVLGYLPQDFGYYPDDTARGFLLYMAALKGLPRPVAERRAGELLETVSLQDTGRKKLKTFSGGMRQRLGIAQAMLNDPQVLVLDEPTAGLDPKERVRLRNLLSDLARERIVLLSTHIVSDLESIADRVFLMKQGAVEQQGTVEELVGTITGKVWELRVGAEEAALWEKSGRVANLRHEGERLVLRVVADEPPAPGAVPAPPTLEDLYLYYFAQGGETP